jgi:hypothetical protein
MKIAFTGLKLPEGKVKFPDPVFQGLVEKFRPRRVSPYYFELLPDAYEAAAAVAISRERVLDLLIHDMDKVETRLSRTGDEVERAVLEACLAGLEEGRPACDLPLDDAGRAIARSLGLPSLKPTVLFDDDSPSVEEVCRAVMQKAGMMFFYTAGPEEVHAWFVPAGADAVTCAGRIHSDLARGFVKAEIVDIDDLMTAHSLRDARARGLTRLVDRDFPIPGSTVLEIRFNV